MRLTKHLTEGQKDFLSIPVMIVAVLFATSLMVGYLAAALVLDIKNKFDPTK
jgi:hypothetical protein